MLTLNIITVSTRPGRIGPAIAKWVAEFAAGHSDFKIVPIAQAEINLPLLDEPNHTVMRNYQHEHTKIWSKLIESGDAIIFVTPEYDFFAPASVFIHHFAQFFDDDNAFQPTEEHERVATVMLEELKKWAGALQPLRNS